MCVVGAVADPTVHPRRFCGCAEVEQALISLPPLYSLNVTKVLVTAGTYLNGVYQPYSGWDYVVTFYNPSGPLPVMAIGSNR